MALSSIERHALVETIVFHRLEYGRGGSVNVSRIRNAIAALDDDSLEFYSRALMTERADALRALRNVRRLIEYTPSGYLSITDSPENRAIVKQADELLHGAV